MLILAYWCHDCTRNSRRRLLILLYIRLVWRFYLLQFHWGFFIKELLVIILTLDEWVDIRACCVVVGTRLNFTTDIIDNLIVVQIWCVYCSVRVSAYIFLSTSCIALTTFCFVVLRGAIRRIWCCCISRLFDMSLRSIWWFLVRICLSGPRTVYRKHWLIFSRGHQRCACSYRCISCCRLWPSRWTATIILALICWKF